MGDARDRKQPGNPVRRNSLKLPAAELFRGNQKISLPGKISSDPFLQFLRIGRQKKGEFVRRLRIPDFSRGREEDALKIRKEAAALGIPVVRDIPLARSLIHYDVGEEVPEELYQAAAAILKVALEESEKQQKGESS